MLHFKGVSLEIWKPIKTLNGEYEASNLGRIRKTSTKKIKDTKSLNKGYKRASFSYSGGYKKLSYHRAVAEAFLGVSNLSVNHIDGNKLNNKINNLEYVTTAQNVQHYYKSKFNRLGVFMRPKNKYKKYSSQIRYKGKRYYLGSFLTLEEAKQAYINKHFELKGCYPYGVKYECE